MKICVLNSETKTVENVIIIDYPIEGFVPYKQGIELAPRHDGEIGWLWTDEGWRTNIDAEQLKKEIREKRDKYLVLYVDSINSVRWETLSDEKKQEFINYRQALLDVPAQTGFPNEIHWPTVPEL